MKRPSLDSILLASADPERLHGWYAGALEPDEDSQMDGYRILRYGGFHLIFDTRSDIGERNPEPGRIILNFDVTDARAIVDRLDRQGTQWLAPLEDRDGSLWATAIDPDGNYVQVIQLSEEHRALMAEPRAGAD
jgi:predicted enzyme related to lactoylglutathione lyase